MPKREPKLQRWTDLLAALLRYHYPATFEQLARDVPAYSNESKKKDAVMRMFERDKDELRSFGIAIETIPLEEDDTSGYKLDRKTFYLPYLSLSASGGKPASSPRKPDKFGYRALATLVVEPDELSIIAAAAARVKALGDPVLAEDADSAMRKLAFDLPLPETPHFEEPIAAYPVLMDSAIASPMPQMSMMTFEPAQNVFELLNDALVRRKRVSFDYRNIGTDQVTQRNVELYGLFFLSSHWYVAANDLDRHDLRNYRVSRLSHVDVNAARSQSADYEIPADFNLREHARLKKAWELGDGAGEDAVVDFRNPTGAAKAAARLGVAIEGGSDRRKFTIRRVDSFARWLLSFGGEAVPVSPPVLVSEFSKQVKDAQKIYGAGE
jgi:predicted DNA-binding transcriptional regulator YafY